MKKVNIRYNGKSGNYPNGKTSCFKKPIFSQMNLKYASISVLACFLLLTTSCKDYLELEPQDNLVQDEFWQNKEQVNSAVAACYAAMNESGFTDRVIMWGELRAEMLTSVKAGSTQQNMMKNYNTVSSTLSTWSNFYETINYCNMVLNYTPQAQELDPTFTETQMKRYMGEALAIRALNYLILVKNFKEVPLVLTATLNDQTDFYVSKNTEGEIINQIEEDLKTAIEYLPEGYAQSSAYDKGRMTKGAALAILADTYLWSFQYDKCIDACEDIKALNKYSLVSGSDWFDAIFFEGNSNEGIFELQFDVLFSTLKNYYYVGSPTFKAYDLMGDLFPITETDKRGHLASYDMSSNAIFKFAGVNAITGSYRSNSQFYNTWIFYRYAEVLLMEAEAYLFSSTQKDLDKVYTLTNQVHERATGTPLDVNISDAELETALLLERQKEFAFEAKRWYDLLRFARRNDFEKQQLILTMAEIKTSTDDFDEIISNYSDTASYFLPIYSGEINLNPNLEQNPYYQY